MSKDLRVVLLGKTGVGKSSTGNTILRRDAFEVSRGLTSGTESCQWDYANVGGVCLQVTDTPGVSDTHREDDEVLKELGKCVAVAGRGPHVILMVFKLQRFTKEEWQAYVTLKKLFGEGITDYLIVVFTGIDEYGDTLQAQRAELTLEIEKVTGKITNVLKDASYRYFGIDNKATKAVRDQQAVDLLRMMQDLVKKNGGKYFSNKLSDELNELVKPLVDNKVKQGVTDLSQAEREINEDIVNDKVDPGFLKQLTDVVNNHIVPLITTVAAIVAAGAPLVKSVKECSLM